MAKDETDGQRIQRIVSDVSHGFWPSGGVEDVAWLLGLLGFPIERRKRCPTCGADGKVVGAGGVESPCPKCNGLGYVSRDGFYYDWGSGVSSDPRWSIGEECKIIDTDTGEEIVLVERCNVLTGEMVRLMPTEDGRPRVVRGEVVRISERRNFRIEFPGRSTI